MEALARTGYTAPPHLDFTAQKARRQELAALCDVVFSVL